MPYIEKGLRPFCDSVIDLVFDRVTNFNNISEIMFNFCWLVEEGKRDGILNYFLTKILLRCKTPHEFALFEGMVKIVFERMFMMPKSYSTLEKADGLLSRIKKELKRRGWSSRKRIEAIEKAETWLDCVTAKYEDEKITQNGDISF